MDRVVVAQILQSEQHPNADRLSVCQVDDGSGTPRQIVCGAKNFKVGDKVPLAQPGAVLPGDFKIKVGKLRGVESQGMMCSAKELGVSEEGEGLLILDSSAEVGRELRQLYPGDTILDLEITPNRADLLCHEGIAREVAALTSKTCKSVSVAAIEGVGASSVSVPEAGCDLYTMRLLDGVRVDASPEGIRARLESLGVRSINNVVDVTNWVMLELGQPLHAFDADKLHGKLCVRLARVGESIEALDGKRYELTEEDLVIADERGPVAIAGVMGGEASGVDRSTRRVILESAAFDPAKIRRTSRRLGLSSDSSYRFERGVDVAGVLRASQRAVGLLQELAGAGAATLEWGATEACPDLAALAQGLTPVRQVPLRVERIAEVLGAAVPDARIQQILGALGLSQGEHGWDVPSFRADLMREIDLIEEIARVVGIEHFPPRVRARFAESSETDRRWDRMMALRRAAVGQGLFEARSLTLVSEAMAQSPFVRGPVRRVKNPLNEYQVVLRPSLVPGLVAAASRNACAGVQSIRLFEIGRVFSAEGVEERTHWAVVMGGRCGGDWRNPSVRDVDLFDLKGIVEAVLGDRLEWVPVQGSGELGLEVEIRFEGKRIGSAGWFRPSAARALDIPGALLAAELDLETWLGRSGSTRVYRELPRFPAVTRDVAFVVDRAVSNQRILEVLAAVQEPLLCGVELFDVFTDATGEKLRADQKSLAYSLTYRSAERTLVAEEVSTAHERLKQRILSELGAVVRE